MLKVYQLRKPQNTFEVTLKYKGVGVRVTFVDGNTYNDIPAKCYTSDLFKQRAIENSQMYRNREIVLERTVEDESDRKAARQAARAAARSKKPFWPDNTPQTPKVTEAPVIPEPPVAPEPPKTDDGLKPMTFDNLGEAIQYIATTWQMAVQTENDARKILKEHGIKPTIKKG